MTNRASSCDVRKLILLLLFLLLLSPALVYADDFAAAPAAAAVTVAAELSRISAYAPLWPAWLTWALGAIGGLLVLFLAGIVFLTKQDRSHTARLRQEVSESRQMSEALQHSRAGQMQTLEAALQLTESLDVKEVLTRIGVGARDILRSYGCAIYLLEENGKTLTPVVSIDSINSPDEERILETVLDVDSSFTGQAVKARRGLIFNDAWADDSGYWIPGTPEEKEERVMVAPFIVAGKVLGAMCLNRIGTFFTGEDLALAETFAAYAGTALKNAQAHRDLQREVKERRRAEEQLQWELRVDTALAQLSNALIAPSSSVDDIASTLLDHARRLTASEYGFVSSIDPNTGDNVVHCITTVTGTQRLTVDGGTRVAFPKGSDGRYAGLLGRALNTRDIYLANSLTPQEPIDAGAAGLAALNNVLIVPATMGGELVGQVALANAADGYTKRSLEAVKRLAELYALAVHRKRAEEALWVSEEKFSVAFRSSPSAISISSLEDGRFIDVNESLLDMMGYDRCQIIDHTVGELGLWAEEESYDGLIQLFGEKGAIRDYEYAFRRQSGELGLGLLSAEIIDLAGESCMLAIAIDITERNRLQTQLLQAQKLEAVGRFAGGVAHDFNNLLTAIIGNAELFLMRADAETFGHKEVEVIRRAAARAAELTGQLLILSRRQIMEPEALNLNDVITGMSGMLPRLVGERVGHDLLLDPDLKLVKADLAQTEQIVLNLVVNASEAMPDGGKLTIATENAVLDEGQLYPEVEPGDYVRLSVSDTGVGMSPAVEEHIWEPFFTTKADGTGLGLATVYGAVKQLGGNVATRTEEGAGTTFEIYLPVAAESASECRRPVAVESGEMPRGDEDILLVEDEFAIRELAYRVLTGQGYEVLAARTAEDALSKTELRDMQLDLMVSDVVLPGINGGELAEELKKRYPYLKILFISGYADDRIAHLDITRGEAAFLAKPFTPLALAEKVRAVLDEDSPSKEQASAK